MTPDNDKSKVDALEDLRDLFELATVGTTTGERLKLIEKYDRLRAALEAKGDVEKDLERVYDSLNAEINAPVGEPIPEMYSVGDYVRKKGDKGQWHGRIVGFYSTECTPMGYAVESVYEKNSVQIYPESALEPWDYAPRRKPRHRRGICGD